MGYRWCPDCQMQVRRSAGPACPVCDSPVPRSGLCPACRASPPPFDALRSWAIFEGPMRQAIHSLKYRRNMALGETLAPGLEQLVRSQGWQADGVVPVPLGRLRARSRGYNQSAFLARPLAASLGWSYLPQALARTRETRSQVGLSIAERRENMQDAFRADPALVSGKALLLVDDVTTTAATIAACAQALRTANAHRIYALTLARALPHHGYHLV